MGSGVCKERWVAPPKASFARVWFNSCPCIWYYRHHNAPTRNMIIPLTLMGQRLREGSSLDSISPPLSISISHIDDGRWRIVNSTQPQFHGSSYQYIHAFCKAFCLIGKLKSELKFLLLKHKNYIMVHFTHWPEKAKNLPGKTQLKSPFSTRS